MAKALGSWLSGAHSQSLTNDKSTSHQGKPERIKVRVHRKGSKEFSDLFMKQNIKAHGSAILTMKFSMDGSLLASAGKDCVIHVWEVLDRPLSGEMERSDSSEKASCSPRASLDSEHQRGIHSGSMKRNGSGAGRDAPPVSFRLAEKAKHSFHGHTEDVLDLSWSYSQFLLSSSKDKTVRLWHVSSADCLRTFTHNDYVTCIQFNPVDDRYFISGSLDDKVRIWSIPDYRVVDWTDIRSMVTAACYTPDGKGAFIGSFKGTCRFYQTTGNKLQFRHQFEVSDVKKKKGYGKVCGVQCMPGDASKLLVTSNDSRVRLFEGTELLCKYKGIRNSTGQMSASFSADGHYIICASEDSRVYIWNAPLVQPSANGLNGRDANQPCEDYVSRDVCVAIPWPGPSALTSRRSSPTPSRTDLSGGEEQSCKAGSQSASPWLGAARVNADVQPGCISKQLFRSLGRQRLHPAGPNELGDQVECRGSESWSLEPRDSIPRAAAQNGGNHGVFKDGLNINLGECEDNSTSSGEEQGFRHGTHCRCLRCSEPVISDNKVFGPDSLPSCSRRPSPDTSSEVSHYSASQVTSPIEPYLAFHTNSIANSSSHNSFSSVETREECGSSALTSQVSSLDVNGTPATNANSLKSSIAANGKGSPQLSSHSSSSADLSGSPSMAKLSPVSPSRGLVIVTAGLGGEIRTFQNYCHVDMV